MTTIINNQKIKGKDIKVKLFYDVDCGIIEQRINEWLHAVSNEIISIEFNVVGTAPAHKYVLITYKNL